MIPGVPDPRQGQPGPPVADDQVLTDQPAPPAGPGAYAAPVRIGCLMTVLAFGGLFIGPLSMVVFAFGVQAALDSIHRHTRPSTTSAFCLSAGLLGELLFALHFPSLVNWTYWP